MNLLGGSYLRHKSQHRRNHGDDMQQPTHLAGLVQPYRVAKREVVRPAHPDAFVHRPETSATACRPKRSTCSRRSRNSGPADRDAAKPRRDDRIPAGSDGLPEDGGKRQARRPANDPQRRGLRSLTRMQLVRTLAAWRPDLTAYRDLDFAYRIGLKSLARRYLELHDEIADLDVMITAIVDELAPNLVARNSIDHIGAAQLLLTAGDNPERLRSEVSFASLCGVSPVPASSGKTVRHRLNRGGDRAANSALHIIAIGRLRTDQRTKDHVARRTAEGHSKLDAIRTLKRYLAREVFTLITQRRKEINAIRIAA